MEKFASSFTLSGIKSCIFKDYLGQRGLSSIEEWEKFSFPSSFFTRTMWRESWECEECFQRRATMTTLWSSSFEIVSELDWSRARFLKWTSFSIPKCCFSRDELLQYVIQRKKGKSTLFSTSCLCSFFHSIGDDDDCCFVKS